ncbi:MAG: outer membrane beta-barrel protein [Marinobacter sp.]|uniref:outer membrane beta-barrel protein n=1 Tax=Marinobacter sp. TaxID=50741 RepID=UPI00299E7327|nr:outer membrane beta-barrel protein [Marinobacter sp.]MDX1754878.1 outer membrane beta-barrel protein [Marinobacter sp.]
MDRKRLLPGDIPSVNRFVLFLTMVLSQTALAEPPNLTLGLVNRYSDNATRVPENAEDDVETRVTVRFDHQTDPGACSAQTAADFGYGVWADDSFDPETYTELAFLGDCSLTDNLRWELADNMQDVVQNGQSVDTPDNRTRKNVFRTGPVVSARVSQVDLIELSGQYEKTTFEENSDIDSDRLVGSVWLNHTFSRATELGIQFVADRAELETDEEIDRDTLSLTFNQTWSATRLVGSVGYSEYESRFMDTMVESDAVVGEMSLERDVSASTVFFLSASHQLTDQTAAFDVQLGDITVDLQETIGVEVTTVRTGLQTIYSDRSRLEIAAFLNKSDYLQTDDEEDSRGVDMNVRFPVVTRLDGLLGARLERRAFEPEDQDDTIVDVDVGLSYQATRKLDVIGRAGRSSRDSNFPNNEYEDNWFELALEYRLL